MLVFSNYEGTRHVAAIVLAAGRSCRMGLPKMLLPWKDLTVIRYVVTVLESIGLEEIVVVTGGARMEVESALAGSSARTVYNPRFSEEEMLYSLQIGLTSLPEKITAALVVLGDQPQIEKMVIQQILELTIQSRATLVVPSYERRRGHPWLVHRSLWQEIHLLKPGQTLRSFLAKHADQIMYLSLDTPSILKDLDTPEDYERERP